MNRAILLLLVFLLAVSTFLAGADRDSILAVRAEELRHELIRGEILIHFPLAVFPLDSVGGRVTWFPLPEMGFRFSPTIPFTGGWFEFPLRIMGMFPFTDDWAALGDASLGCEVHVPPVYAGVSYRFLRGKIYPLKGNVYAHIAGVDLGIPVEGWSGTGIAVDWILYTKLEIGLTEETSYWDWYDGNILTLAPHWSFSPGRYGRATLTYRFPLMQKLTGYNDNTGATYDVGKGSFSLIEFKYVYP
ncbi:MAG TPA: hypothetical protein ENN07_07515 [candidate division Zixibacteria bacterium]|nr:hypothetical protein [candidate division Zixibacteria bacterium]